MINDTTNLIFHFADDARAELSAVQLGRLVGSLQKTIRLSGRHLGVRRVTFYHALAPVRGSLKFCFRVNVEGEIGFTPARSSQRRRPPRPPSSPMEAVGAIAGVGALLAALFAPDGMYDVFHNGAQPSRDLRAALAPSSKDGSRAPLPKADLEKCLLEIRDAAAACGAERVEIELPDFAPTQLSPVLAQGPMGKAATLTGHWKITISTPMGDRHMRLYIKQLGGRFAADVASEMGKQEIHGTVEGDTIKWATEITNPMPMTLEFEAKAAGNFMRGTVKLGMFGNASLVGEREFPNAV